MMIIAHGQRSRIGARWLGGNIYECEFHLQGEGVKWGIFEVRVKGRKKEIENLIHLFDDVPPESAREVLEEIIKQRAPITIKEIENIVAKYIVKGEL